MSSLNLLEKTELWVNEITLEQTNLTDLAAAVARVLGLPEDKVMVVDVRPNHITFDLLEKEVQQENILGKEEELLAAGITPQTVRLSIGTEHIDDLIDDLKQGFDKI